MHLNGEDDELEQGTDWGAEVEDDLAEDNLSSDDFSPDNDEGEGEAAPAAKEQTPAEDPEAEPKEEGKPAESKEGESPSETPEEEKGEPGEKETEPSPDKDKEPAPKEGEAATEEKPQAKTAKELEELALTELEKHYALSDDDAKAFEENPTEMMPKLMAKAHWSAVNSVMHSVSAMLPRAFTELNNISQAQNEYERQFFTEHPELKNPEYTPVILRNIRAYKAANPNADAATVIKGAGALAKLELKIAPQAQEAAPTERKPHTPAQPGSGTGAAPKPRQSDNPWEQEFEEDLNED